MIGRNGKAINHRFRDTAALRRMPVTTRGWVPRAAGGQATLQLPNPLATPRNSTIPMTAAARAGQRPAPVIRVHYLPGVIPDTGQVVLSRKREPGSIHPHMVALAIRCRRFSRSTVPVAACFPSGDPCPRGTHARWPVDRSRPERGVVGLTLRSHDRSVADRASRLFCPRRVRRIEASHSDGRRFC